MTSAEAGVGARAGAMTSAGAGAGARAGAMTGAGAVNKAGSMGSEFEAGCAVRGGRAAASFFLRESFLGADAGVGT